MLKFFFKFKFLPPNNISKQIELKWEIIWMIFPMPISLRKESIFCRNNMCLKDIVLTMLCRSSEKK